MTPGYLAPGLAITFTSSIWAPVKDDVLLRNCSLNAEANAGLTTPLCVRLGRWVWLGANVPW